MMVMKRSLCDPSLQQKGDEQQIMRSPFPPSSGILYIISLAIVSISLATICRVPAEEPIGEARYRCLFCLVRFRCTALPNTSFRWAAKDYAAALSWSAPSGTAHAASFPYFQLGEQVMFRLWAQHIWLSVGRGRLRRKDDARGVRWRFDEALFGHDAKRYLPRHTMGLQACSICGCRHHRIELPVFHSHDTGRGIATIRVQPPA